MRLSPCTTHVILFLSLCGVRDVRAFFFAPPMIGSCLGGRIIQVTTQQISYHRRKIHGNQKKARTGTKSSILLSMKQVDEGSDGCRIEEVPLNQIFQKAVVLQRSGDRTGSLEEYNRFLKVAESHEVDPTLYVSFPCAA